MGNILTAYTSVFMQCIRKRNSQRLIDIDFDGEFNDDEKIIFYNRKDDSLKNYEMMEV